MSAYKTSTKSSNAVIYSELEQTSPSSLVFRWGLKSPPPVSGREFVVRYVFKQLDDGDLMVGMASTQHPLAPAPPHGFIRALATRAFRISAQSPRVSKLTTTSFMELGGAIPKVFSDTIVVPTAARTPLNALRFFVFLKPGACSRASERARRSPCPSEAEAGKRRARSEASEKKLQPVNG